jgi:hypothetical protein
MSGLTFNGLGALGGEQDLLARIATLEKAAAAWDRQIQGFLAKGIPPSDPQFARAASEVQSLRAQAAKLRSLVKSAPKAPLPGPRDPEPSEVVRTTTGEDRWGRPPPLSIQSGPVTPRSAPVPVSSPTAGGSMSMNVPAYESGGILKMISSLRSQREPLGPISLPRTPRFPVVQAPLAASVSPWVAGAAGLLAFGGLYYWATR